jgi:hypothetical protein
MNNFSFERREDLRNIAKDILNKQGASNESMQKILDQTIFDYRSASAVNSLNSQLSILKASTQITMNNSLKETLKYLKTQSFKKTKKQAILGELWELALNNKDEIPNELIEFEINMNNKNIFEAA